MEWVISKLNLFFKNKFLSKLHVLQTFPTTLEMKIDRNKRIEKISDEQAPLREDQAYRLKFLR